MTIPVWKKGLGLQKIDEVRICREGRWVRKHLAGFKQAYAHAPYFEEHLPFLENTFQTGSERLIDFNLTIMRHLMLNLGLDTEFRTLSELNIQAAADHLLIEICQIFNASGYLAPAAAGKYLTAHLFEKAGIELLYVTPRAPVYPQLWREFIPDLSAFDLLFNCGPKSHDIILAPPPSVRRSR